MCIEELIRWEVQHPQEVAQYRCQGLSPFSSYILATSDLLYSISILEVDAVDFTAFSLFIYFPHYRYPLWNVYILMVKYDG